MSLMNIMRLFNNKFIKNVWIQAELEQLLSTRSAKMFSSVCITVLWSSNSPTLDSQTSSHGVIWHRIDICTSAVACLEAVTLTGSWHTLKVSQLNGISLDNVWPSYFLYFEVIGCAVIGIILFSSIVHYIKVYNLSTIYRNSDTVKLGHVL